MTNEHLAIAVAIHLIGGAGAALIDQKFAFRHWLLQLFIALDQLANVLVTPFNAGAFADETLSSRAYRAHRDSKPWGKFWMPIIDLLFRWQGPNHCESAYTKERERVHSPPEQRISTTGA